MLSHILDKLYCPLSLFRVENEATILVSDNFYAKEKDLKTGQRKYAKENSEQSETKD